MKKTQRNKILRCLLYRHDIANVNGVLYPQGKHHISCLYLQQIHNDLESLLTQFRLLRYYIDWMRVRFYSVWILPYVCYTHAYNDCWTLYENNTHAMYTIGDTLFLFEFLHSKNLKENASTKWYFCTVSMTRTGPIESIQFTIAWSKHVVEGDPITMVR